MDALGYFADDGEFASREQVRSAAEFGTLVLDRHGHILSSGDAVAQMMGVRADRLRGQDVADFVDGLCLGASSARYRSGYLDYLAANPTWRELDVRSGEGCGSVIWFKLSAMVAEGQRLFLMTLRRNEGDGLCVAAPPCAEAKP